MNPNAAQISELADNLAKVQSFDPWSARWISEAHMLLRGLAARDPVAEVVEWKEDDGTSKNCVSFLCPIAEIPVGAKLYADASSAEPARPVEALEVTEEMAWEACHIFYGRRHGHAEGSKDRMKKFLEALRDDAALIPALAHPRPTGDTNEVPNDTRKHRMDSTYYCGDKPRHLGLDAVHDQPADTSNEDLIAFLDDLRGRYAAGEDECACDYLGRTMRILSAPTVEQAGEVVAHRIVGSVGPYAWNDGAPDPSYALTSGERYELAYAQPRPVGVPDGLIAAARGLLADYEEDHGEGACDCMPEPENARHCCNACLVRAFTACAVCEGRGGWFFAHSSHDQEWVECTECAPTPAKAGGA